MTLQQELDAINQRLAATLAEIAAAAAKQKAIDDANRQAVLLKQQQHLDQLEADRQTRARCWLPYQKIIDAEKARRKQTNE